MTPTPESKFGYVRVLFTLLLAVVIFLMTNPAVFGGDHNAKRTTMNEQVVMNTGLSNSKVISSTESEQQNFLHSDHPVSVSQKKNLMFLKTHKCGTSSLVNVFYLRGVRKKLNFVIQPDRHLLSLSKTPRP